MRVGIIYSTVDESLRGEERDRISDNDILNTVRSICDNISKEHEVIPVKVDLDLIGRLDRGSLDLIFNLCENFNGDPRGESWVASYLEMTNIPYTGSGPFTLALCLDKGKTKQVLKANNIPTPEYQIFHAISQKLDAKLQFPLIVKPLQEDASVGIDGRSVARNKLELFRNIGRIIENYDQPAIVEEYIKGREINVSIIGTYPNLTVLPLSEIIFEGSNNEYSIVGFEAKWEEGSSEYTTTRGVCPAELDRETEMRAVQAAKEAYRICGCRDYGRVDIRSKDGKPFVLEVNPNPGIGEDSGFFRSAKAAGMNYREMIEKIMKESLARNGKREDILQREKVVYRGDRISLRSVGYSDIEILVSWMNDPVISKKMDEPETKIRREVLVKTILLERDDMDLIVMDVNDKSIGFGSVYDISEWNGTCEISYFIGDEKSRNKGYGKEIVKGLLDICRNEIGAKRVLARVVEGNDISVRLLIREGFREVGILKGSHVLEETSFDEHLFEKLF